MGTVEGCFEVGVVDAGVFSLAVDEIWIHAALEESLEPLVVPNPAETRVKRHKHRRSGSGAGHQNPDYAGLIPPRLLSLSTARYLASSVSFRVHIMSVQCQERSRRGGTYGDTRT